MLPDNPAHERQLVQTAAASAGLGGHPLIASLDTAADSRRLPGPVITHDRDHIDEGIMELIDARNYFVWAARDALHQMTADPTDDDATRRYAASMSALAGVITGYAAAASAPRTGQLLSDADRADHLRAALDQ